MTNKQVFEAFSNKKPTARTSTGTVFIDNGVIYSYGHHWPMAVWAGPNWVLINTDKTSPTTSKQTTQLRHALLGTTVIDGTIEDVRDFF